MNIYLALLLSVAGFAAGWGMAKHRQRYIIKGQGLALDGVRATGERFRYVLSTTEAQRVCMALVAEHLKRGTESQKSNLSPRYEPS